MIDVEKDTVEQQIALNAIASVTDGGSYAREDLTDGDIFLMIRHNKLTTLVKVSKDGSTHLVRSERAT